MQFNCLTLHFKNMMFMPKIENWTSFIKPEQKPVQNKETQKGEKRKRPLKLVLKVKHNLNI